MRSKTIIASTYGIDQSEIENYRYQSTRTKQPIYSIGEYYFSCGKKNLQMKLDMNGVLTLTNFGLNKTKQFFGLQNLKLQERAFKHHERL